MPVPPSLSVVMLVLGAAFLHALWNALVKGADDRVLMLGMVVAGHTVCGAALVAVSPAPAPGSWPFLLVSVLVHYLYFVFLLLSYRFGDLSVVYPVARGVSPVLVALGGLLFAGDALPAAGWAGILLVSGGIGLLLAGRGRSAIRAAGVYAALLNGLTIAAYTVLDGMGARASGNAFGYVGWLLLLEGLSLFFFLGVRWDRLRAAGPGVYAAGMAGGMISGTAYTAALYAATLTNLATVSAIRETSVIMAALIGVVWFGERPWRVRVLAAAVVAAGVAVLATAG